MSTLAHNGVSATGWTRDGPEAVADSGLALAAAIEGHVEMILASHVTSSRSSSKAASAPT